MINNDLKIDAKKRYFTKQNKESSRTVISIGTFIITHPLAYVVDYTSRQQRFCGKSVKKLIHCAHLLLKKKYQVLIISLYKQQFSV